MKYFKKLIGENIYLSPMNIEDAETYTKWMNDFNVTDYLGINEICTMASEKNWIEESTKNSKIQFAIVNLKTDILIGNIGLMDINQTKRCATVGIFIGEEENRGKGYGTDAIRLLLDYGFNYLNYNNIMLNVFSFNERAIASYKKVGFKEFGRRRQSYFLNGKYYDEVCMDILAEEFKTNYIKNKQIK